jgi:hypothetical protein
MNYCSRKIVHICLVTGVLLLTACGGGSGGGSTGGNSNNGNGNGGGTGSASQVIGAAGGKVQLQGGAITLDFPAGAVTADTTISITPGGAATAVPAPVSGTYFTFSPEGTTFAKPVHLTINYDPNQLPAGTDAATMQIAKATSDGWLGVATTVDTAAHTASADLMGFSTWGLTPGFGVSSTAGVLIRSFPEWNKVQLASIATDTAGVVSVLGYQSQSTGGPLTASGGFLARLNANLTVQWVRSVPADQGSNLALDQQGNAFIFCRSFVTGVGVNFALTSYNPSGALRAGFPVIWSPTTVENQPSGLVIDAQGNAHTLGISGPANQLNTLTYSVHSNSGGIVRAPTTITMPLPAGATLTGLADLALDFNGRVYFEASYGTNTGGGTLVTAALVNTLGSVSGYPVTLNLQSSTGFGRPMNSVANAPLTLIPLVALSGLNTSVLNAFNVLSGGQSSGFPVTLPIATADFSTMDITGVTRVVGIQDVGALRRIWVGSYSTGGVAIGTPKVFGLAADTFDNPYGAVVDPAGMFYVSGTSRTATSNAIPWIARVP